jgi:serine/threonine-protein kinase
MADGSACPEVDVPDLVGEVLPGGWKVARLIGTGAMGHVYEGRHLDDGPAKVAIKVLHQHLRSNREVAFRFRREAEILEAIDSPQVPRVFDRGTDLHGRPFLVLEHLCGQELSTVIHERGSLAPAVAVAIALKMCRALAASHRAGIVHRDLKPDNVMVSGALDTAVEVKVLDFSISKVENLALTRDGAVLGTPAYMPPEQAMGCEATPRVDVYAAGAVLYEMLTGRPPFCEGEAGKTLAKLLTSEAPRPRDVAPSVPPRIEQVVLRAICKDASRRTPTVEALEAELLAAIQPEPDPCDDPSTFDPDRPSNLPTLAPPPPADVPSVLAAAPASTRAPWLLLGAAAGSFAAAVATYASDAAVPNWSVVPAAIAGMVAAGLASGRRVQAG